MTGAAPTILPLRRARSRTLRRLLANPVVALAAGFLLLITLAAILVPLFSPFDPYETTLRLRLKPPGGDWLLGTDTQGRDLLTRLLYGTRTTLLLGLAGVAVGAALGGNGLLEAEHGLLSAAALAPALLGMALGQALRRKLPEPMFRKVFFAALLALGAYIVARAL